MNREVLTEYIRDNYSAEPDCPWPEEPDYEVFRHSSSRKWFAVMMKVPRNRLGLQGQELLQIVNFKCDPILLGSMLKEQGFFPAYHMSKVHWITAALDGSAADDRIRMLLDLSFAATEPKTRKKMTDTDLK